MASDSEDELGTLDLMSPKFDPLKTLYSKNARLPIPKAPILDNIHKYRSALNRRAKKQSAKVCCRILYSVEVNTSCASGLGWGESHPI